ncbi:MAG: DNA polymerase III subunit alpha [Chlamydiae bacterium]|nr:DNA polymerase III subunit alpha [Chlamydiota bacterium]
MTWIPLHAHSQYSILDSTISIDDLVKRAKSYNLPKLALTDFGNMYGAVDFYKSCTSLGIEPIVGLEILVSPTSRFDKKKIYGVRNGYPIVLLAKNKQGYNNLCKLSSLGFIEGFYYSPRIDLELLEAHSEGLICLSGGLYGRVGSLISEENEELLQKEVSWFKKVFQDRYYFEMQRHVMLEGEIEKDGMHEELWLVQKYRDHAAKEALMNERLKALSKELDIPLVATSDIRYLEREDWRAHEVLLNIQSGEPVEINGSLNPKRETAATHAHHFRSSEQMCQLFADVPEAIANTLVIAEQCSWKMDFKKKYYPVFIPPSMEGKDYTPEERSKAAAEYLQHLCDEAIPKRYTEEKLLAVKERYPDKDPLVVVKERLAYEMGVITSKEMSDYLLIVYDFISWAKNRGIAMGPGRGSGVGSIILYLIEITDVEPLRFNLFFERFINPERISYPDIDVDICMHRRPEVIEYTLQKYGKENVAQIITFGTMKAKMAIKDVGRVLNIPISKVNAIAKLVPDDLTITIEKALEVDPDFLKMYQEDAEAKRIIDLARRIEGGIRNTGIHAAGLIICADPLIQHIPVCLSKDSEILSTQYSMKPVEQVGMLKIDFLGLKTLTSIQKAVEAIRIGKQIEIDWVNLPLADPVTFALLAEGKTEGIFQLESGGMQELAKQLHIDKFEEIIAMVALYRPGPMEMIPSFINRKHGREKIEIDHPWMADILQETYGIIVYQEQVMQIASKLANYSLGEGDVLRRAMGKKDKEEMSKQREKFRDGALQNGIDEGLSMLIFDKVEKFASYGFNKSHAAVYGYLSYVTAYLKANYPGEWMAALMTCDMDDISKVAKHTRECQAMGIAILAADINESGSTFVSTKNGIRFALTAIKGVGEGVVDLLVQERNENGSYQSLQDFLKRIDTLKIGKKMVEQLIWAGAFDFTNKTRKALVEYVEKHYDSFVKERKDLSKGILDLFADAEGSNGVEEVSDLKEEMPKLFLLQKEKELLGFYVTGHPLDEYQNILKSLESTPFETWSTLNHASLIKGAFVIESLQTRVSNKSQKKFAILTISNALERFELPIWPDLYEQKGAKLQENALFFGILFVDRSEGELKLSCKWIDELSLITEERIPEIKAEFERCSKLAEGEKKMKPKPKQEPAVQLILDLQKLSLNKILKIRDKIEANPGNIPLHILFRQKGRVIATLELEETRGIKSLEALDVQIDE